MRLRTLLASLTFWISCGGGGTPGPSLDAAVDPGFLDSEEAVAADLSGDDAPQEVAADLPVLLDFGSMTDLGGDVNGNPGWPCTDDAACLSGHCVEIPDGRVCAKPCADATDCGPGEKCWVVETSPTVLHVCVHPAPRLCRPCIKDSDCQSSYMDTPMRCADHDGTWLCLLPCPAGGCGPGFVCRPSGNCHPDPGACEPCPPSALGVQGLCQVSNSLGTCAGVYRCQSDGPGPCEAAEAVLETCNGRDDDCDGLTDNAIPIRACIIQNAYGTCGGQIVCVSGQESCQGANPGPELCNGVDDDCDGATDEGYPNTDADGTADCTDPDKDGDDISDELDDCPLVFNPDQADLDDDGLGDACDPDRDGDGILNDEDDCPVIQNPDQADQDKDGVGDACDPDRDSDGVANETDNCPGTFNPGQTDLNGNGVGDSCETDWDGDGIANDDDGCPWVSDPGQEDLDGDGVGDACDCDIDDDEFANAGPGCPDPSPADVCPRIPDPAQDDLDADGQGDACDPDRDGDGVENDLDCAPDDPTRSPAQAETCNGIDDDCDGLTDEPDSVGCRLYFVDEDGDGFGTDPAKCLCVPTGAYAAPVGGDCADDDVLRNPGAPEECNGADDDCDGMTDEPDSLGCIIYYKDVDGDGFGNPIKPAKCLCVGEAENDYTAIYSGDCADLDPTVHPGAPEVCNGKDEDCNVLIDDNLGTTTCGIGGCAVTVENCIDGKLQTCVPGSPGIETCNGIDDDCDGATDEDLGSTTCGVGECGNTVQNCVGGKPQTCVPKAPGTEICDGKDNDCDGATDEDLGAKTCGVGVCKVTVPNCVNGTIQTCVPGTPTKETCNGLDDDCDGATDEDLGSTTCGVGECGNTVQNCVGGKPQTCVPKAPGTEICDKKDNDCDGSTDEGGVCCSCAGKNCGDPDGCGGTCAGPCPWSYECNAAHQCVCGPEPHFKLVGNACLASCGEALAHAGLPNAGTGCCQKGCKTTEVQSWDCPHCCSSTPGSDPCKK